MTDPIEYAVPSHVGGINLRRLSFTKFSSVLTYVLSLNFELTFVVIGSLELMSKFIGCNNLGDVLRMSLRFCIGVSVVC